ncbi:hypothetical protein WKH53_24070 [Pantoea agglomerans]|uniref:hypothetical protein n=1 Tax=Enterobacter agglomerans TaxID=549 RepID=UPI003C7A0A54
MSMITIPAWHLIFILRFYGGTCVKGVGNDGVTTRPGLRAYLNGKNRLDQQTVRNPAVRRDELAA